MKAWTEVEGWLSVPEGEALRRLALGKVVLELGAWKGRSSCAMGQVAEAVLSVDTFTGDAHTGPADTYRDFLANVRECAAVGRVIAVRGEIGESAALLPDDAFDLAFIDSAHDAASVERDARIALRLVKPGGVIAWHDCHYPTVQEGLAAAGLGTPEGRVDSLAWLTLPETA